jgi:ABC-type phosphate/phosphonate transport system ATPase subunit
MALYNRYMSNIKEEFKYSSIAISGPPGAGRSTLLRNLKPIVEPWGWQMFSGGEWARQFAIQNGKHKPDDPIIWQLIIVMMLITR